VGRASFERSDVFPGWSFELDAVKPVRLRQLRVENSPAGIELGINGVELAKVAGKERRHRTSDFALSRTPVSIVKLRLHRVLSRRIVSGVPSQQAIAVGGPGTTLKLTQIGGRPRFRLRIHQEAKFPDIGHHIVSDRHFKSGDLRLFTGYDLPRGQQSVQIKRGFPRWPLVSQNLA